MYRSSERESEMQRSVQKTDKAEVHNCNDSSSRRSIRRSRDGATSSICGSCIAVSGQYLADIFIFVLAICVQRRFFEHDCVDTNIHFIEQRGFQRHSDIRRRGKGQNSVRS